MQSTMNERDNCDILDAYLADDLSPVDRARFEAHVPHCNACRDAMDQQRWIDGLLVSPLSNEQELPPIGLYGTIHSTIAGRRRLKRISFRVAVAAVLIVAVGWTVLSHRQAMLPEVQMQNAIAVATLDQAKISHPASFVAGPDAIAVPVESPDANVTIVRVYPVYREIFATRVDPDFPASELPTSHPTEVPDERPSFN
jgi:hypothetical protein